MDRTFLGVDRTLDRTFVGLDRTLGPICLVTESRFQTVNSSVQKFGPKFGPRMRSKSRSKLRTFFAHQKFGPKVRSNPPKVRSLSSVHKFGPKFGPKVRSKSSAQKFGPQTSLHSSVHRSPGQSPRRLLCYCTTRSSTNGCNFREFVKTHIILTPGACGWVALSCGIWHAPPLIVPE